MNDLAVTYKTNEKRFYARQQEGIDVTLIPCRVIQTTLPELISQYREQSESSSKHTRGVKPCVTPDDLSQTQTKYVVIIEDGNKEAPTDYVFDILFELYSAARSNNHVLILHGALSCDYLKAHMNKRASSNFWNDDYESTVTQLSEFWKWISGISDVEGRGSN